MDEKEVHEEEEEVNEEMASRMESRFNRITSKGSLLEEKKKMMKMKKKKDDNEDVDAFISTFNKNRMDIERQIMSMEAIDSKSDHDQKEPLTQQLDKIINGFEQLKIQLAQASMFLPSYNIKKAQDSLTSLAEAIEAKRNQILPKKKFTFNKKTPLNVILKETSSPSSAGNQDTIDNARTDKMSIDPSLVKMIECSSQLGFKAISNAELKMTSCQVDGKDVQLTDLTDCKVEITGTPRTVHIENLIRCQINIGPTSTSIFISNCKDCFFHLACQQLRVHTTNRCSFYTQITSRIIIEASNKLRFGRFEWHYNGLEMDFEKSGLDSTINNWTQIDDFDWLSTLKPSPHFQIIESINQ